MIVAEPPETANYQQAIKDGFQPLSAAEAVRRADVVAMLLPDELQPEIFRHEIRDNLSPGKVLVFAHGFSVRFGQLDVPQGVSTVLVSPMGPGSLVRAAYVRGEGVPCLIALGKGAGPDALQLPWPMPRRSAARGPGPSKPPSSRRPRPTCLPSRPSSAAA